MSRSTRAALCRICLAGLAVVLVASGCRGAGKATASQSPTEPPPTSSSSPAVATSPTALVEPTLGPTFDVLPGENTSPTDFAVGAGAIWIAGFGVGRLLRVDSATGAFIGESPQDGAYQVVTDANAVWFTSIDGNFVVRVDLQTDTGRRIPVGRAPTGVGTSGINAWVANSDDGTVSRIDSATKTVVATISVGSGGLTEVVYAAGFVWVMDFVRGRIFRIDASTDLVMGKAIKVGDHPGRMVADGTSLWVANQRPGALSRIDLRSGEVTQTIPLGREPTCVAVAKGYVWVMDQTSTLVRVDPITGEANATSVSVPEGALGLAAEGDRLWILARTKDGETRLTRVDL